MQLEAYFQGLCLPAQIYLAITVVGALGSVFKAPGTAMLGSLFGVVWSAAINIVCQNGYATAAWTLALAPSLVLGMAGVAVAAALTAVPHHQLATKEGMERTRATTRVSPRLDPDKDKFALGKLVGPGLGIASKVIAYIPMAKDPEYVLHSVEK
jgi:hypothetical protein